MLHFCHFVFPNLVVAFRKLLTRLVGRCAFSPDPWGLFMARAHWKFRPREVDRAIKTARRNKLQVTGFTIAADGAISISTAPNENDATTANEWDKDLYAKDQTAPVR
jgi:hypothetical protein